MRPHNLLIPFILAFLVCSAFGSESLPEREIPITLLFEFDKRNPKPNQSFTFAARRYLDTDHKRCVYVLDKENHRVLKYTEDGTFITQIGSIGKNAPDLYYPTAIRISGDHLYIVDGGIWIKKYTLDGQFVSRIESRRPREIIDCLDVEQGRVFVNLRKISDDFNRHKLITVFDSSGKKVAEFGDVLSCLNIYAFRVFNRTSFSIVDGNLIGTFVSPPVIFRHTTSGKKIYQKDLRELGLDVIRRITEEAVCMNIYDTPERQISPEGHIRSANYCRGFDVDEKSEAYYAVGGELEIPPVIYRFDRQGMPRESIKLKLGINDVAAVGIFINRGLKTRYGVGHVLEGDTAFKPFFFKF
ncbi:MAG: 6-bladed beta-propeller [Acidobacteriota bacterium]|nr:6-bladed beta-propeller [Acidobacteriota bacterium]